MIETYREQHTEKERDIHKDRLSDIDSQRYREKEKMEEEREKERDRDRERD